MNTIIWIGLFMFIMGTIILVSSYQSIFNQSAKAGGIIAALCIYLLLDGVAVMLWGNHNYIIAFFIGGLGLLLSVCTSQQKVDTTLYSYTSFNEHNTPYTVLESDNSESMPDVLH
jgi:uncharacterized membrane protein